VNGNIGEKDEDLSHVFFRSSIADVLSINFSVELIDVCQLDLGLSPQSVSKRASQSAREYC
jgi:hypothetical protein